MVEQKTNQDNSRSNKQPWQRVLTLWLHQSILLIAMLVGTWLAQPVLLPAQPALALSVLAGALIFWVPNAYFALYAFRFRGAQAAALILQSMYRGEFGKLLLTAMGFALVFVLIKPIYPLAVFLTFIIMTISQWILVSRWSTG